MVVVDCALLSNLYFINHRDLGTGMRLLIAIIVLATFCTVHAGERSVQELAETKLEKANHNFDEGDFESAKSSYLDLAYLGHKYSMYRLAIMLERGLGEKSNLIESWAWASLAAENGTSISLTKYAQDLWQQLPEADRVEALARRKALARTYSDVAVVVRLDRKLEQQLKSGVGSRVGAGTASVKVYDPKTGTVTDASKLRSEIKETREKLADYAARYGTVELREVDADTTQDGKENPALPAADKEAK